MSENIKQTLEERGKRYGSFKGHAEVTQTLKQVIRVELTRRNKHLSASQQEAIDMTFHKIGRIVNGEANYIDSWRDIVGYNQLVVDELLVTNGATDCKTEIVKVGDYDSENDNDILYETDPELALAFQALSSGSVSGINLTTKQIDAYVQSNSPFPHPGGRKDLIQSIDFSQYQPDEHAVFELTEEEAQEIENRK